MTVDFDDLTGMSFFAGTPVPSESVLTNQYADLGVVFTNAAVVALGNGHATSTPNGIGGISPTGTLTYSSHYPQIEVAFFLGGATAVTDFVSIRGDLSGGGPTATLYAYDVDGNQIGFSTQTD